ncbi:MAG: hypothetical protein ABIK31_00325 [candidate division WOR-3 bacterium]
MPVLGPVVVNQPKNFYFNFYYNGVLQSPYNFDRVEIYRKTSLTTSVLVTTLYTSSAQIVEIPTSSGQFQYTVTAPVAGDYFERIIIYPTPTTQFIKTVDFTVLPYDPGYSGTLHSAEVNTCRVWGQILNTDGTPRDSVMVVASIITFPNNLLSTNIGFAQPSIITYTDKAGYFSLYLPRGVRVFVSIQDILFHRNILVPDLDEAQLFSLVGVKEIGDTTNDITSGEALW